MFSRAVLHPSRTVVLILGGLVLALYGRHLADGYLADDFLYLRWLEQGLDELLRRVTWLSDPQMIRPLPALAWTLSRLPHGASWLHALSLLLHTLVGVLLARRITCEIGDRPRAMVGGTLFGAFFIAFPLFGEPVIWLSSATDLWAASLALVSLELAFPISHRNSLSPKDTASRQITVKPSRLLAAALLFAAALLCKETVLLLPVIALALLPPRSRQSPTWHPHAVLGLVALLYLGIRLWLFAGLGGYQDDTGSSQALSFDPKTAIRNTLFQLPLRLLFPLIRDEGLPWGLLAILGLTSLCLMGGFAATARRPESHRSLASLLREVSCGALAFAAALLPVFPVLSVDADHGGSRLIYWPVAIAIWVVSRWFPWSPQQATWGIALIVFWSLATFYNTTPWSMASRRLQATLEQLPATAGELTPRSVVYFDGFDSWKGAYLWRNGFLASLERRGITYGIDWRLGNAAMLEEPQSLGDELFIWELDSGRRLIDRTICDRDLLVAPLSSTLRRTDRSDTWTADRQRDLGLPITLRLEGPQAQDRSIEGRLFWRRGSRARFNISDSKSFRLGVKQQTVALRLGEVDGQGELQVRVQLNGPGQLEGLRGIDQLEMPQSCLRN